MIRPPHYSPLKAFLHRDRIDLLRAGGHPPPVHVHLVPTNRCNHGCRFCAYRAKGYSSSENFVVQDQIAGDRLLGLIDELASTGVRAIEFTGGGEPTLHPAFAEACGRARRLGMDYAVVTNGYALDEDRLQALAGATWVRFSMDAGTPETYSMIRNIPSGSMEQTRSNLRRLVGFCKDKPQRPVIGVGFVVNTDNWEETLLATQNALADGADNMRLSAVFQNEGAEHFRPFLFGARNLCRRAEELNNDTFVVFNLFGDRLEDLHQASPDYTTCHLQRFVTYLGADLNVYRCCVVAYNHVGLLGSVADRDFVGFWNDPETIRRLEHFDARGCPRCMFNQKNRTIDYALMTDPPHGNFL